MGSTVIVAGIPYAVRFNADLAAEHGALGRSTGNRAVIELDPGAPAEVRYHTLLHEIVEQLNYLMDLGLNHHQVELLALGLYQVLTANDLRAIAIDAAGSNGGNA